jgi:4-amino-4-deoxy-L-arabinose transferase-like glycosyltransferase
MSTAFYPPLNDLITAGYFAIAGPSVFMARLVSVTFAVLTIGLVFEFTRYIYDAPTAFISAVLLSTMPGFIWLAQLAMVDTLLVFFYSATLMLFFIWLKKHENKYLFLSGATLGLGLLAKYPIIAVLTIMIPSILFLGKDKIKKQLSKIPLLILIATLIALPWILLLYQTYTTNMLDQWIYVMGIQIPQSLNVPTPIYYLIAMVWPYGNVHPISFIVYTLGLTGLCLLLWRRQPEDKFLLIWFITTYIFFTLIGQTQWRYIVPIFPTLAISAGRLATYFTTRYKTLRKNQQANLKHIHHTKIVAAILIIITTFGIAYSCLDTCNWTKTATVWNPPLEQTANYVNPRIDVNESIAVIYPVNVVNCDIIKFYIRSINTDKQSPYIWQYPDVAMDTHNANFNTTELINFCKENNTKYLILYEYGETFPYYNTTLTMSEVNKLLIDTQVFTLQTSLGNYPQKIFVYTFSTNQLIN